jgi:thiamine kinase-like enzyme
MAMGSSSVRGMSAAERLDMVPVLAGRELDFEPIPGGLTNANYKVNTGGHTYFARLSDPSTALLAIDRAAEHHNSVAAASTGVAPAVVDFTPKVGVLVIEWITGRTLEPADLRQERTIRAVADACRRLHAGPRFASDFDMFAIQRQYLRTALDAGFRLPDRYVEFMLQLDHIRTVLRRDPPVTVPCHNDLLAANFISEGDRLWLIDYEYSGNNDPCFELGNIWSESNLAADQLDLLVSCYFGRRSTVLTARARLLGLVSQYGWTLWGVIQHNISELDFDFWSWAMEKYDRAVDTFDSPDLADLLATAAEPDSPLSKETVHDNARTE